MASLLYNTTRVSWICFRCFFTLYQGKSPSNYHLGEYMFTFSKQIQGCEESVGNLTAPNSVESILGG